MKDLTASHVRPVCLLNHPIFEKNRLSSNWIWFCPEFHSYLITIWHLLMMTLYNSLFFDFSFYLWCLIFVWFCEYMSYRCRNRIEPYQLCRKNLQHKSRSKGSKLWLQTLRSVMYLVKKYFYYHLFSFDQANHIEIRNCCLNFLSKTHAIVNYW